MYATANQVKAGQTIQIAVGGEIVEIYAKSVKTTSTGVVRINGEYALAADQSVFIRYQLTADMRDGDRWTQAVVKLENGMYWRGNDAAPVKTKACAGIMSRGEARAFCEANAGTHAEDAPRSRNV